MTQIYRLHFAPDNASLIVRIALEHLDVPYDAVLVDRSVQAQQSTAYKALNPLGMIPAMETPDGVIFETGAILLWLADRHAGLLPDIASPARGDALKWLFFISNSLHAGLRQMFYPEKFIAVQHAPALREGLSARIRADFTQIDTLIGDPACTCFGGDTLSALDIYACVCLRWAQLYPKDMPRGWVKPDSYDNLNVLAKRLERTPALQCAQRAEGLGPTPLTQPTHATPPIGSAT